LDRVPRIKAGLAMLATFSLVTFAWIFFRAESLGDALYITRHLVSGWRSYLAQSWDVLVHGIQGTADLGLHSIVNALFRMVEPLTNESRVVIVLSALALFILLVVEILQYRGNLLEQLDQKPVILRRVVYASLLAAILILGTSYASVQQAFIYFQF
jgi:hypothetical protein